jgi:DNA-binding transcriptional MocR family regulator
VNIKLMFSGITCQQLKAFDEAVGSVRENDSEFRYNGRPIPALKGFDQNNHVISCGSFSKVLLPSLRLGYLVVPADLAKKFAAVRFVTDRHPGIHNV